MLSNSLRSLWNTQRNASVNTLFISFIRICVRPSSQLRRDWKEGLIIYIQCFTMILFSSRMRLCVGIPFTFLSALFFFYLNEAFNVIPYDSRCSSSPIRCTIWFRKETSMKELQSVPLVLQWSKLLIKIRFQYFFINFIELVIAYPSLIHQVQN